MQTFDAIVRRGDLRRSPAGRRPLGRGIVAAALLAAVPGLAWADPAPPSAKDKQITRVVTQLLQRAHLSRRPIDDEIAKRFLEQYVKGLDPMKMYFYQSDMDRFRQHESQLDDEILKADVRFAHDVFSTYLQRVDERLATVRELINEPVDFTIDDEIIVSRDEAQFPKTPAEARELWRKRVKYDLLVQKSSGASTDAKSAANVEAQPLSDGNPQGMTLEEARKKVLKRYETLARRLHQTDSEELLENYLSSLTAAFDPHTSYMGPRTLENFDIYMRLELEGIGAALSPGEEGYTVVSKIIPGGAADKDGRLKAEDRVIGVGQGSEGEIVDVSDWKLSDVVDLIRGKRGTIVRLHVLPVGQNAPVVYQITREKVELKDSEAQAKVFEQGRKADGSPFKVGVIDLPSFYMDMSGARQGMTDYRSTTRDVRKILDTFRAQNVDAVVMDLRRNGGGSLTEAIDLTGLFIDTGPVVQVKDALGSVQHYDDDDAGVAWRGPLVVLISKFSASASEIFAGAIQDYQRGVVVGDQTTHGKGTVQSLLDLSQQVFQARNAPKLGALKVTMQQFYRPNGASTQDRGVVSDIELPSLTTHLKVGEADLDHHLEFDQVPAVPFQKAGMVDPTILDQLRMLSQQRVKASPDFQKMQESISRYNARKDRKSISLNEEKFLAERKELDSEKAEEKELEKVAEGESGGIQRDYYMDEALAITLDYLKWFQVAQAN